MTKQAVVIGASRGIGAACAIALAEKGMDICLMSRSENDLSQLSQQLGKNANYIVADIANPDSMQAAFRKYDGTGRTIDVLVNNSGIYRENQDTFNGGVNKETVYQLLNTNMLGYWWSTEFAKPLLADGASVINISSVNGIQGKGNSDVYDMTKAGINNLTLNLARQLAPRSIRVNAVCPSSTITPMRDDAMERYSPEFPREKLDSEEAASVPLKRLGTPEDIANTVAFLASDEASYITGQIISVDGGYLLKPTFPSMEGN